MQVFTLGISEQRFRISSRCPNETFGPANSATAKSFQSAGMML